MQTYNLDYTASTRKWLDQRYKRDEAGIFVGHRPIYGFGKSPAEKNHTIRFGIAYGILKVVNRLEWGTMLDIGGGEGYISWLVRNIFHKEAYTTELSTEANLRAGEFFGLSGITADVHRLPFRDGSFDIVLASEVIEHLQYAHIGLYEMARVADKAVILTTAEAYASPYERRLRLKTRNFQALHSERNYWLPQDFKDFFHCRVETLTCTKAFMDIDEASIGEKEAKALVRQMTTLEGYDNEALDAMILVLKKGDYPRPAILDDDEILDNLFRLKVDLSTKFQARSPLPLRALCCPACKGNLSEAGSELRCTQCGGNYPVVNGVPLLLAAGELASPLDNDFLKARITLSGREKLIKLFSPPEGKPNTLVKIYSVIILSFLLLIRYINSSVSWKIKFEWLKNKAKPRIFLKYFSR